MHFNINSTKLDQQNGVGLVSRWWNDSKILERLTWSNDNKNEESKQDRADGEVVSLLCASLRHSTALGNILLKLLHLPVSKPPWSCLHRGRSHRMWSISKSSWCKYFSDSFVHVSNKTINKNLDPPLSFPMTSVVKNVRCRKAINNPTVQGARR